MPMTSYALSYPVSWALSYAPANALLGGAGKSDPLPSFVFTKASGLYGPPTVVSGGTGHSNGDLLTASGGTFDAPAVVQVTGVSAGVITSVAIVVPGSYTVAPTSPVTFGNATLTCNFESYAAGTVANENSYGQSNAVFRWDAIEPRQNIGSSGYFGNNTYLNVHSTIEFVVNAAQVDLEILAYNASFDVTVTDYPQALPGVNGAEINTTSFASDASGSPMLLTLRWLTKRSRVVRIGGFNLGFGGAQVAGSDSITASASTGRAPLAVFLGDSYTADTGANSAMRQWCNTLCNIKGWECLPDGIGGDGWTTTGADLPNTRVTTDLALRTQVPSRVICAMGYNDGGGNMTTLASQFATAVASIKSAFPSATIQVLGPWTPLGGTANLTLVKNALITACTTASVTFVDIENIINAGNSAQYGLGDLTHPNQAGHDYLGQQIAARVS
jgi:lysophospholipase L1-like esterase